MLNAFVAMPYHEPYESLYCSVIVPALTKSNFHVVRADKIPGSNLVIKDIHESIEKADLVVIEATEPNENVYYEFGFAAARNKEILILAKQGSKPPFNTQQWRHLLYDPEKLDKFREDFVAWLERTIAYQRNIFRVSPRHLNRGDVFPDIVDASLFIDVSEQPIDERILSQIRAGGLIPCSYSYYTDVGTVNWLRLCADPLYTVFHESVHNLSQHALKMFEAMGKSFIESSPDLVSLGPGNGQKDRILLKSLVKLLISKGLPPELYYYPIDVSPRMLTTSVRTVSRDQDLAGRLKIKVGEGNFENISSFRPMFDFRPAPNLFLFLGNTLGNVDNELWLLTRIKNAMQSGDVMILEVRLKTGTLELGGPESYQFGLSFSPLQHLGVTYDRTKIKACRVGMLSQIPDTVTVAVHYTEADIQGKRFDEIVLSFVNYYDRRSLANVLENTLAFQIIDFVESPLLCLYVIRKP